MKTFVSLPCGTVKTLDPQPKVKNKDEEITFMKIVVVFLLLHVI